LMQYDMFFRQILTQELEIPSENYFFQHRFLP
jgi:hypothetical protein